MRMERVSERGRGDACKGCRGDQDTTQKVKEVEEDQEVSLWGGSVFSGAVTWVWRC